MDITKTEEKVVLSFLTHLCFRIPREGTEAAHCSGSEFPSLHPRHEIPTSQRQHNRENGKRMRDEFPHSSQPLKCTAVNFSLKKKDILYFLNHKTVPQDLRELTICIKG